jgi:photosystem II stability/assembly factor-like uncharacterized protein
MYQSTFTRVFAFFTALMMLLITPGAFGQDTIPDTGYGGMEFRNLTPAFVSGRISDFAVNPENHSEYYVAVASGHIWKTVNNGTSFKPVFDNYSVYSIGCLAMDPNNSNVIWAGTGENNHQRSVSYGDGVYKSVDAGKSWKNMGLKESMQIGMIAIDPRNSDVVYVAAEGSVWGPGGERGLYKSIDGGESWEKIFEVSEQTGVNNVVLSPDNPDILYITTEQRRRRTQMRIGGGPESNVYKSTDSGNSFRKLSSGIPSVHKGGMGIAVSPVDPEVVYLMVEAAMDRGGFFKSTDRGESFVKMSDYNTSGQYYGEIFCDPVDVNTVYATETYSKYTVDGGKTWKSMGNNHRHVDDHALWVDPYDTNHYLIGGDGGVYETFDRGKHFIHKTNLPVTQFYKVGVDNAEPFYHVYGGTQDNSSLGAPSNSLYSDGISRCEWVITLGGDGFWQAVDPQDPNIVYSEYQYGNLYRHDKQSGEITNIKPRERAGEKMYKWNWNTPMIISKHSRTRLFMAANKVFKSEDRGNTWEVISDDITAGIPRDTWPVMDHFWSVDAVAKNVSTSLYGTAVAMAESPLNENILFVGTDDGMVNISEDMGKTWRKIENFPGVPKHTYVSDIIASKFDEKTFYVSFDNRKHNDLKPYILKSSDLGTSWTNLSANLPENGPVHALEQDFKAASLMFAGTEFGVYFSIDEGVNWVQLKSGIPTISVKDIALQERENDLVLATFGRGFYILDNYAPLRELKPSLFEEDAHLFDVKDALQYFPKSRGGYGFGSMPHHSKNRTYGAVFTYYLKEVPQTEQQQRRKNEKELFKNKERIPIPSVRELIAEEKELIPHLQFVIRDDKGEVVRILKRKAKKGINREAWNLKYASSNPQRGGQDEFDPLKGPYDAMPVLPGKYEVELSLITQDSSVVLAEPKTFSVEKLNNVTLPAEDMEDLLAFSQEVDELSRVIQGARRLTDELETKLVQIKQSIHADPKASAELLSAVDKSLDDLADIQWRFQGQIPPASYEERIPDQVPINDRLSALQSVHARSSSMVTGTQRMVYEILESELPPLLDRLDKIANKDLPEIEIMLDAIKAPWTPGRVPKWKK